MGSEIVHFEIPAQNPAKLSEFYKKSLGWTFKDSGMKEMKYWMIKTATKPKVGGGMYKKDNPKQGIVNYYNTPNIQTAIDKIKKNGGRIVVDKMKVMDMGWSAIALDPEGNMLGLFQPAKRSARR
jgi:predicted enzyme related to lactoylglutathione lyase